MKILTLFGTRPEIIRLSCIIPLLDEHCEQILVHTGQNYDPSLSQVFLDELKIRTLDHHLGVQSNSFGEQAGADPREDGCPSRSGQARPVTDTRRHELRPGGCGRRAPRNCRLSPRSRQSLL